MAQKLGTPNAKGFPTLGPAYTRRRYDAALHHIASRDCVLIDVLDKVGVRTSYTFPVDFVLSFFFFFFFFYFRPRRSLIFNTMLSCFLWPRYKERWNILLLGDSEVGKTSFAYRVRFFFDLQLLHTILNLVSY